MPDSHGPRSATVRIAHLKPAQYRAAVLRRYRRLSYKALGSWSDRAFDSRLCWIFGTPRSGSSWLLGMLDEHDRVYSINEPLIGFNLSPFLADTLGFEPDGLTFDTFSLRRINREREDEFFADSFRRAWQPRLGSMLRERFRAQVLARSASDPHKAVTLVKEPNGSQSADLIMAAMPASKLLALYRDPRDAIDSELAANEPGSWATRVFPGAVGLRGGERLRFAQLAAHKWAMRVDATERAFECHRGPKLKVFYEEMRRNPASTLSRITSWLELDVAPGWLQDVADRHSFERLDASLKGDAEFARAAEPGRWRVNLRDGEREVINRMTVNQRCRLGYGDT